MADVGLHSDGDPWCGIKAGNVNKQFRLAAGDVTAVDIAALKVACQSPEPPPSRSHWALRSTPKGAGAHTLLTIETSTAY